MKLQEHPAFCGPAALQAALEIYGYKRSQRYLATLCGTKKGGNKRGGTTHQGILRGITRCGFSAIERTEWPSPGDLLRSTLFTLGPVVLCVDQWEHWITAIGVVPNDKILVWEPGNYYKSGLLCVHKHKLLKRWKAGPKTSGVPEGQYYGIVVTK